jgi:hypothetical protein
MYINFKKYFIILLFLFSFFSYEIFANIEVIPVIVTPQPPIGEGTVKIIDSGNGLTGGPVTTVGTLEIDTNIVVTTTGAYSIDTTGIITASAFYGDGSNLTGIATSIAGSFVNIIGDTMTGDLTIESDLFISGEATFNTTFEDKDFVINKQTSEVAYLYDAGGDAHRWGNVITADAAADFQFASDGQALIKLQNNTGSITGLVLQGNSDPSGFKVITWGNTFRIRDDANDDFLWATADAGNTGELIRFSDGLVEINNGNNDIDFSINKNISGIALKYDGGDDDFEFDSLTTFSDNVTIEGVFAVSSGTGINEFSIDGTLAGDSDDALPTEKAVKTYIDNRTIDKDDAIFAAYDTTGGQTVDATPITLNIDTVTISDASFTLASDEVTFNTSGTYEVFVYMVTEDIDSSGGARCNVELKIQEDVGAGFIDITDGKQCHYHRETTDGCGPPAHIIRSFNSTDKITFIATRTIGTTNIQTKQYGAKVRIKRLR